VLSKFRMALRSVHGKILEMTKSEHLNYLRSKLTKVKRWKNKVNHHEKGVITFFHDEVDQVDIWFNFYKFWSSRQLTRN
jgi:hypothetical protein